MDTIFAIIGIVALVIFGFTMQKKNRKTEGEIKDELDSQSDDEIIADYDTGDAVGSASRTSTERLRDLFNRIRMEAARRADKRNNKTGD